MPNRGDAKFVYSDPCLVGGIWRDKKIIRLLSTIHGADMTTCIRAQRDENGKWQRRPLPCPAMVRDYSAFMGGVDLFDELIKFQGFSRKTVKWTKKFFFYGIDAMRTNSFVITNSFRQKPLTLNEFNLLLAQQLIAKSDEERLEWERGKVLRRKEKAQRKQRREFRLKQKRKRK